ncbi:MAG: D-alanyl-D-alanine carboxypeptidase [Ruminococcaceae bacterium]|nr:D-alanyl-D-alanine carboxypeptidase [Oscillospiraceae bacterium]
MQSKRRNTRRIKIIAIIISLAMLCSVSVIYAVAEEANKYPTLNLDCRSALLMEAETGKILYANNENEALPPASVTKVMTLLLVMEALESKKIALTDMVAASEHACSMGGSQIYLEVGEQMSVEDLLKSVVIASANDAAVTLAEYIAGTEDAFVEMMNKKAAELGMKNTNFENTNGLDDTTQNHVTSAMDIAIMSRELIKYKKITEYSSIWMDTVRNGEFGLTNTNRLIRFYKGATGLKTGSTSKAGFCITATAERDGMTLIAVIMASPSRDARNASAVSLLNYGFSNFALYRDAECAGESVKVINGVENTCSTVKEGFVAVVPKSSIGQVEKVCEISQEISAPVKIGDEVGKVQYTLNGEELGSVRVLANKEIKQLNFFDILIRIIAKMVLK